MSATAALARLRRLGKPVVTTDEASLALGVSRSAASHTLRRLEQTGLVQRVRHGLWAVDPPVEPLLLPEYLTAPLPSYVSFQSALFLHGMISQIPEVIYVASLAQTRRVKTRLGTFSIHRVAPGFFGGYETVGESDVRLAVPEKALLDTLYLVPARSRLFARLPEVELPERFSRAEARRWLARIPSRSRRTMVARRLDRLLAGSEPPARPRRTRLNGER
jgi:predicted transcriptional regulator of viral defense system